LVAEVVRLPNDSDEKRVVDDFVLFEELGVSLADVDESMLISWVQPNGISFLEIIVLLGSFGIAVLVIAAVGGALDVVPFDDPFPGVEDIGHDDEVAPAGFLSFIIFFNQFVESEEFGDEGIWIFLDVIVVVFKDGAEEAVFTLVNGFEHVLSVSGVVEEGAGLALTGEGSHRGDFAHHEGGHEFVGADTVDVVLVVDFEDLADVVEGVGCVVAEGVDRRVVVVVAKPPGNQLEAVLQAEVLGLLADDLLQALDAPDCHLDADHHVQHQVPVLVPDEHHAPLRVLYAFVHVLEGFLVLLGLELLHLHLLPNHLVYSFCLLHDSVELVLDELQLLLKSYHFAALVEFFGFPSFVLGAEVGLGVGVTVSSVAFHFFVHGGGFHGVIEVGLGLAIALATVSAVFAVLRVLRLVVLLSEQGLVEGRQFGGIFFESDGLVEC
jgi:hypothetical protein